MIDKKIEATIKLWRPIFYSKPYYNEEEIQEWVDEIKSLFKEYAMEIIGEDERLKKITPKNSMDRVIVQTRNSLRAEQREKVGKI